MRLDPNLKVNSAANLLSMLSGAGFNTPMEIRSIVDADGRELKWRNLPFRFGILQSNKGQLSVTLPKPLEAGGRCRLVIDFHLLDKGISKEMTLLQDDPYHSLDAWYPKAMSWRDGKWSIDDDRPSDYDVTIELPAELTVASTGEVVEEKAAGDGRKVLHLRAQQVRGFTVYGWPGWKQSHRTAGNVKLSVMLPESESRWAESMLDAAADAIAFYEKNYGPFPTRHLDIVCPGSPGGRAHGSSATCGTILIWLGGPVEKLYRPLMAHEVAHQYFGSKIGLHRREIAWASVGLGLMMDGAYIAERDLGTHRWRKTMDWFYFEAERRGYDTTLSQPVEKPVKSKDRLWARGWNMSLMHAKARFVCSMLEDLLGKEEFKNVVRKIIAEKSGGVLANKDLIVYCEAALGEPLDWFVADWIDGRGTLDYAVGEVKQVDNGWRVGIANLGDARFPVVVEAETTTGEKLRQRVDRTKKSDSLLFKTDGELKQIVVDPDNVCPDVNRSNNRWTPAAVNKGP